MAVERLRARLAETAAEVDRLKVLLAEKEAEVDRMQAEAVKPRSSQQPQPAKVGVWGRIKGRGGNKPPTPPPRSDCDDAFTVAEQQTIDRYLRLQEREAARARKVSEAGAVMLEGPLPARLGQDGTIDHYLEQQAALGVWDPVPELQARKRPIYRQRDTGGGGGGNAPFFMHHAGDGRWHVTRSQAAAEAGEPGGCMAVTSDALLPEEIAHGDGVSHWQVHNSKPAPQAGSPGGWADAPAVRARACPAAEAEAWQAAQERVKQIVCRAGLVMMRGQPAGAPCHGSMGVWEPLPGRVTNDRPVYIRVGGSAEAGPFLFYAALETAEAAGAAVAAAAAAPSRKPAPPLEPTPQPTLQPAACRGQWQVGVNKAEMEAGAAAGLLVAASDATLPADIPAEAAWRVWDGAAFIAAPRLRAGPCSAAEAEAWQRAEEEAREGARRRVEAAGPVRLQGQRPGDPQHDKMGVWEPVPGRMTDARPVYLRQLGSLERGPFLYHASSDGQWWVNPNQTDMEAGAAQGWMAVKSEAVLLEEVDPGAVWSVFDGAGFVPQPRVKITDAVIDFGV
jgi:hypothetical protein